MNAIRLARENAGMEQKQLANKLGVSPSTVCMWEADKRFPKPDKLPELARILGCTIDDLFREHNRPA